MRKPRSGCIHFMNTHNILDGFKRSRYKDNMPDRAGAYFLVSIINFIVLLNVCVCVISLPMYFLDEVVGFNYFIPANCVPNLVLLGYFVGVLLGLVPGLILGLILTTTSPFVTAVVVIVFLWLYLSIYIPCIRMNKRYRVIAKQIYNKICPELT